MVEISQPEVENTEIEAVLAVLKTKQLTQGSITAKLEEEFAKTCITRKAVALSSGTAALHTALQYFSTEISDPRNAVITTPFTFIATVNSILASGKTVKFADIDPLTFNIDCTLLQASIDKEVAGILTVDIFGQLCNYSLIEQIAADNDLFVVEDACQAVGASIKARMAGSFGDAGCFSLYATKNIMSAEGGMITTDNIEIDQFARSFRQHGMAMDGEYGYTRPGLNYRMTDIHAAIGLVQLGKLGRFTKARRNNAVAYHEQLSGIEGITVPSFDPDESSHAFHQYTIRVDKCYKFSRDELAQKLRENGCGCGVYYPLPLHLVDHIRNLGFMEGQFPQAELACQEVLSLPVHPAVPSIAIEKIADIIREA